MPLVSVVIPTYNHAEFIRASIDSVLGQTFTDYEIIVVNDGSPDDTERALKSLIASGCIRYIEQSNTGQAGARNRGLAEARGEFVAFLDDDDFWPPDKLEWQVKEMYQNPDACLIAGFARVFNDANQEVCIWNQGNQEVTVARMCESNPLTSPGQALIRRRALAAIGGFRREIWGADDWDLYFRLARQGRQIIRNRLALHYRIHSSNASHNSLKMVANCLRVVRDNVPDGSVAERRRLEFAGTKTLLENYSPLIARKCKAALRHGNWQVAAECLSVLGQFRQILFAKPYLLRIMLVPLLPTRVRAIAWWLKRRVGSTKG